jgi:hypothetical protein
MICPTSEAYGGCRLKSCKGCHGKPGRVAHIQAVEFARVNRRGLAVLGVEVPTTA